MRVVIIFNPLSGAGRAMRVAERVAVRLAAAGYETSPVEVGPGARREPLGAALAGAGALVVVGGDGTVHHAAMPAAESGTPIYHFPMGTENLFAREFGMDRDVERLVRALDAHAGGVEAGVPNVTMMDAATANGRPFLLMASIGVDANVVHRLSRARTGSISHLSYAPHIVREIASPYLRPLTVTVDGDRLIESKYATVIIANTRQYAMRVDPAEHADPSDGLLDVVVLPGRSWVRTLGWFARARLRRLDREARALRVRGARVVVESHGGNVPYQIDGEAPLAISSSPTDAPATTPLEVAVQPGVVPVLTSGLDSSHPTYARLAQDEHAGAA